MALDYDRLNRRYGPWVSLALGFGTLLIVERGAGYAPVAVASLVLAWTLAAALGRWLAPAPAPAPAGDDGDDGDDGAGNALRRALRSAAGSLVVGLYQNVLFYLIPVWLASATWTSVNVLFPLLLGAMAVFSCFEYPYREHVVDRPWAREVWSAVVLFAALAPGATALFQVPIRWSLAGSGAVAGVAAAAALVPRRWLASWVGVPLVLLLGAASTGVVVLAAPWLPPAPLVCTANAAGTAIADREARGTSDRFPAGTDRVYAWFAVGAPDRFRQRVRFEWYRDGEPAGRPLASEVVGGRKAGFRTWAFQRTPRPGDWRVDLVTDAGALIGRVRFEVR